MLAGLCALAAVADFIAADLPVLLRLRGTLYVLPNLLHPASLRAFDNQRLAPQLGEQDWAVFPPVPWGQNGHDLDAVLQSPSTGHWLGTDSGGRDVCARLVHGARVSMSIGVLSAVLMCLVALAVGVLAGYRGGLTDALLMRLTDTIHAVPTLLLVLAWLAVLRPSGYGALFALIALIGLTRWTDLARLVRAEVLRVCALPYVEAARALGLSPLHVMTRHVLRNVLSPVLVAGTFAMGAAILLEGALSFLGFGLPDDVASWGGLLREGREHVDAWWLAVFPGFMLFLCVAACNGLAERLRDAIDPTLEM
jgi:peptide/nickel transport system permease protein